MASAFLGFSKISFRITESIAFLVSVELADDLDTEDVLFLSLANIGELPQLYNILHQSLHDAENLGLLVIQILMCLLIVFLILLQLPSFQLRAILVKL